MFELKCLTLVAMETKQRRYNWLQLLLTLVKLLLYFQYYKMLCGQRLSTKLVKSQSRYVVSRDCDVTNDGRMTSQIPNGASGVSGSDHLKVLPGTW